jgi:hypothetical protein
MVTPWLLFSFFPLERLDERKFYVGKECCQRKMPKRFGIREGSRFAQNLCFLEAEISGGDQHQSKIGLTTSIADVTCPESFRHGR